MPLVNTGKAPMANESESEDRPEKIRALQGQAGRSHFTQGELP